MSCFSLSFIFSGWGCRPIPRNIHSGCLCCLAWRFAKKARDRYLLLFFEKPKPLTAFHSVFSFEKREGFASRTDGFADSPVCFLCPV